MVQNWLIAFGAGVASALLVATVATGSALALPLFYLAPLPVLIVGLGWSHLSALVAASTAAVGIGVFFGLELLTAYVAGVGLPAYALAYLALMARQAQPDGPLEWFPVGRVVLAAAILGCLAVAALIPLVAGSVEGYQAALREMFQAMFEEHPGVPGADTGRLVDLLVIVMPPAAAVVTMVTQLANLWLAAHAARLSGRLMRPWPDLAAISVPRASVALLIGALIAASLDDGFVGLLAELLGATLVMAFAFIGLATIHWITRGAAGRTLVIATVWIAALALGWPFAALALLGLAETLFGLRGRFKRGSPPKGPPAANDG
ncbi:conserved hypothetical protein [Ancylobacter novellus DSM 506]|uniref:DUF2232 domain-containing protein n=1 Tax=Ancylobacter novellus (strain ATCC 8093 / DSM 506 / JCM 20403 / CCM 1077 / IAM 12100 / NBRC 12443 / NCIMB 10456) TaxID=639283 RepID=D7A727_ANCN5|nr:DUF2232 domain-containing protein [Ancylobacter novellus]ADH88401.1 conserved hypothetical protein [Ancylobacter novellus DSM 506]